ncbi:hypothetical protein DAPPUDRAFT_248653 [Daphnia pulex]|uniref:Uncharacterized protein n=1 Tax=Daphnia pulex TaxID=6669 RepID=E9GUY1_DAPPU|nr:hypothetical protein DAPPUDRAFT_248653 [Daphnia pulex]|eukprot:EFX76710.1 hypothetical protein DAPPUDRAFT_248653 [Daphnia pulex]
MIMLSRQHPNPSANQLHVIRPQSLYIPDQEIKTEKMLARSRKGFIALDYSPADLHEMW